jgi:hypothetical protein
VTSVGGPDWPNAIPEADLAEQQTPVDIDGEEGGLDPTQLTDADAKDVNLADLIEQSVSVPLPADDYEPEE